jgi:hypothetical protein
VTEQQAKRKPGRPSKGKRGNFTFRVTDKLRNELIARAEASGLSVSEEIERMLDQSINGASIVEQVLGGPHNSALLLTIASAIRTVESLGGKKWYEDHDTNLAMRSAVSSVMDFVKTPSDMVDAPDSKYPDSKYGAFLGLWKSHFIGTGAAEIAVGKAVKARRSKKHKGSKS